MRLDVLLADSGRCRSRARAAALIKAGGVCVDGVVVRKPAQLVHIDQVIVVADPAAEFVGRGAAKLASALMDFGLVADGRIAADLGASTGGFTQVLLRAGARRVFAVDVGHGQLAPEVAADPRVVERSGVHVKDLEALAALAPCDLVVADLSFISVTAAFPALHLLLGADADAVVLIKPQFEAGRAALKGHGVVADPEIRVAALTGVLAAAVADGFNILGVTPCAVSGERGNREVFAWLRQDPVGACLPPSALKWAVRQDGVVCAQPEPSASKFRL